MSYEVRLEVFEGPLDLLLNLVSRERLDVADVSMSSITDDYLKAVRRMEEVDLEVASGFLVLAATLLELKSIRLLPDAAAADPEVAALLEERDHLLHRLIEYSTFKNVSVAVARVIEENKSYHSRAVEVPQELVSTLPDLLAGVSPERLRELAVSALAPRLSQPVDTSFMTPIRVSVREMVDRLSAEIKARGTSSFRELCVSAGQRIEVIVRFLALLEMFKEQSVELEQDRPFSEIVIRWREPNIGRGR